MRTHTFKMLSLVRNCQCQLHATVLGARRILSVDAFFFCFLVCLALRFSFVAIAAFFHHYYYCRSSSIAVALLAWRASWIYPHALRVLSVALRDATACGTASLCQHETDNAIFVQFDACLAATRGILSTSHCVFGVKFNQAVDDATMAFIRTFSMFLIRLAAGRIGGPCDSRKTFCRCGRQFWSRCRRCGDAQPLAKNLML